METPTGFGALEKAKQKIPEKWYEKDQLKREYLILVGYAGLFIISAANNYMQTGFYPIWPHVASGTAYIASHVFDTLSTVKCFNSGNKAWENGIKHGYRESAPYLSNITTSKEFLYSPKYHLRSVLETGLSFLFPGLGLPFAGMKTLAALSNSRIANRLNLAVNIAQNEPRPE